MERTEYSTYCWLAALAAAAGLSLRSSYWLKRAAQTWRTAERPPPN